MPIRLTIRGDGRNGGAQSNGGQGGAQNNGNYSGQSNVPPNGTGYQNNGQPNAYPHGNGGPMQGASAMMGGVQNGGAHSYGMTMSYPVQQMVPPAHVPPYAPGAMPSARMGFHVPYDELMEGMEGEEMRRRRSRRTGRFLPSSEYEEEESMRAMAKGGGSRRSGMEMGHAEGEEGGEELRELKRDMKKLKKKFKKMERELEEMEEGGASGGKRKKKRREEEDDEDDEDDRQKPAAPSNKSKACALMEAIEAIPDMTAQTLGVLSSPPPTWAPYVEKGELAAIAKMEAGELIKAIAQRKPLNDLKRELLHLSAALFQLCGEGAEE